LLGVRLAWRGAVPSGFHEVVVELLREAPARIVELLRDVAGTDLGRVDPVAARVIDPTVPQLVATAFSADVVIELPAASPGPAAGVIVEVQRTIDRSKGVSWPIVWATTRHRLRGGLVYIVVITDHERVARWARHTLLEVIPSAGRWIVLGPTTMPRITDPARAERDPEAVAISALIHAGHDDVELVGAIAAAFSTLAAERAMMVYDVLLPRLTTHAVSALEVLMQKQGYEWQSDFARKHRAEGRADGLRMGLELILQQRGLALSDSQQEIVRTCAEPARFEQWIRRAATAGTADEVFSPES
jgi:hypothetical protein